MSIPDRLGQAGLTLIELILFILVVGIGVSGVLSVMNITSQHSSDALVRKQALAVAESLLEEIQSHSFSDPDGAGPEASRQSYDDVSDYSGFSMTGIQDMEGNAISGLGSYNASVTVSSAAAWNGVPAASVKTITVTVTAPGGESLSLSGLRTDY